MEEMEERHQVEIKVRRRLFRPLPAWGLSGGHRTHLTACVPGVAVACAGRVYGCPWAASLLTYYSSTLVRACVFVPCPPGVQAEGEAPFVRAPEQHHDAEGGRGDGAEITAGRVAETRGGPHVSMGEGGATGMRSSEGEFTGPT